MIAVKRLQSLFWVLFVALGALSAYLVSLKVATERNELMRVRGQIAAARGDIRYLETEFGARASMRQLERWASQDFHYSALGAERYLADERQLAQLDGLQANGPDYAPQPVLVAMIESDDRGQAAPVVAHQEVAAPNPAALQIPVDVAPVIKAAPVAPVARAPVKEAKLARAVKNPVPVATVRLAQADKPARPARTEPASRKAERMAMLDAQLLDSRTLSALGRKAALDGGRAAR